MYATLIFRLPAGCFWRYHYTKSNPIDDHSNIFKNVTEAEFSNHWATIPACSVIPSIYKQSKKKYCHVSF